MSGLLSKSLRSSTFKLALLCILTSGGVVLALFSYVYLATDAYVLSRSDRAIDADREDLISAYGDRGRQGLIEAIDGLQAEKARADALYLLADTSFRRVAGNLSAWPGPLQSSAGRANFAAPDRDQNLLDRPEVRVTYETLPDGFHLLVGRNVGDLNQFMTRIHIALAMVILLVFAITAVVSAAVMKRTVARIESINVTTHAIMQSGLGRRVPLRGTQDEWDNLAGNINNMLDRIETLMAEVKQATDNVAHDLRTPLARMRGRLERASLGLRDARTDTALINESIADLDDVMRMFSALTRISQLETATRTAAFCSVDLVEVAEGVVELFDAAAEVNGVHLAVTGEQSLLVTGDRDLLFDALANLVDNAIKHGREGGRVLVEIKQHDDQGVMCICDDGPGIPEHECKNVFKRFYRLQGSRCMPGNGLGLSLVAAVARLHEASIRLLANGPGLKVELRFPVSAAWTGYGPGSGG